LERALPPEGDFEAIVSEFAEKVYNHALRMLGDPLDAEEATSDVFLRIHRSLETFRHEAKLSTWIWKITTNVCLSSRGKKKVQTLSVEAENVSKILADHTSESNPEESYLQRERREELGRLISRLPPREAAAIMLHYMEGMDYSEISSILEIPMGSVATALHRGRERLRSLLEKRSRRIHNDL